jgi:hypothetical protein
MAHRQSTIAGVVIGLGDLAFCVAILAVGKYQLGFDIDRLRTLTLVTLLFNGQAVFYVVRERRRLWSSWPSPVVVASSIADLAIIPTMAVNGILMAPLPMAAVLGVFAASLAPRAGARPSEGRSLQLAQDGLDGSYCLTLNRRDRLSQRHVPRIPCQ